MNETKFVAKLNTPLLFSGDVVCGVPDEMLKSKGLGIFIFSTSNWSVDFN
jgi:hypothetical protein